MWTWQVLERSSLKSNLSQESGCTDPKSQWLPELLLPIHSDSPGTSTLPVLVTGSSCQSLVDENKECFCIHRKLLLQKVYSKEWWGTWIFYPRDCIHTCSTDCRVTVYITFAPPKWNCFLYLWYIPALITFLGHRIWFSCFVIRDSGTALHVTFSL